ncbi:MAG: hypothetical protein Q8N44_09960 [Rubrivivax sp.]|nr:hypothetical protein [Rubrivivax sp.]MDP3084000.1 hypothetical protein [Rubrivivax sp.]
MAHPALNGNPFMLMMNPEVILAAIEGSERLSQLASRMCRPLDKPMPGTQRIEDAAAEGDEPEGELAD